MADSDGGFVPIVEDDPVRLSPPLDTPEQSFPSCVGSAEALAATGRGGEASEAGGSGTEDSKVAAVKTEPAAPAEAAPESSDDDDDFGDALNTAGDEVSQPPAAEEALPENENVEEEPPEDLRRVDPPCPTEMQVREALSG